MQLATKNIVIFSKNLLFQHHKFIIIPNPQVRFGKLYYFFDVLAEVTRYNSY